jgi:hypothetical protein
VLCCAVLCFQVELIVGDIKESVSRVSDVHFIAEDNMTVPSISYEVRRWDIGPEFQGSLV